MIPKHQPIKWIKRNKPYVIIVTGLTVYFGGLFATILTID